MALAEVMIGQTIGVPHQVQVKESPNLIKLEIPIIGVFGGGKNLFKILTQKFQAL